MFYRFTPIRYRRCRALLLALFLVMESLFVLLSLSQLLTLGHLFSLLGLVFLFGLCFFNTGFHWFKCQIRLFSLVFFGIRVFMLYQVFTDSVWNFEWYPLIFVPSWSFGFFYFHLLHWVNLYQFQEVDSNSLSIVRVDRFPLLESVQETETRLDILDQVYPYSDGSASIIVSFLGVATCEEVFPLFHWDPYFASLAWKRNKTYFFLPSRPSFLGEQLGDLDIFVSKETRETRNRLRDIRPLLSSFIKQQASDAD